MINNKINTIAFFWIGKNIDIPTALVRSIRLVMNDNINVIQLTDHETEQVPGVNSTKRFDLSNKIMIARLEAYSQYEAETENTFFCDSDCLFINQLKFPDYNGKNILLSPRLKNFKINYNYPEYYEEFKNKTANEVMPFLFCAIATKGNQQNFFINLLNICLNLPDRFHRWYGDQYSLHLKTKAEKNQYGLLEPMIYQHEIKQPLVLKYLEKIHDIGTQILHFKGPDSKILIKQALSLLNHTVKKGWRK